MNNTKQHHLNRKSLLNQGVALLIEQGYHGTGLKQLLGAVNIPKGSFYHYFGSKEQFTAELIDHYIAPYVEQLQGYLGQSHGNALAALQRYAQESMAELERTQFKGGCLLGNLTGEVGDTSAVCRAALQAALTRYRNVWELGLSQAQNQGAIRTDKSARELADLWVNSWQGALLRMKVEQSSAPLKQCYQTLLGDYFKAPPCP